MLSFKSNIKSIVLKFCILLASIFIDEILRSISINVADSGGADFWSLPRLISPFYHISFWLTLDLIWISFVGGNIIKKIISRPIISSFYRCLVGGTFIVSGIIKGNDSMGFSYKLEEYFQDGALAYRFHEIFGWDSFSLEWLVEYALFLAIFISIFEIVLGFCLIVKAEIKTTLFFVFSMLIFFTFLTLHTATCVPGETVSGIPIQCVDDCGCFGDAMKDSFGRSLFPWESFQKDILLIIFSIPIFVLDRKKGINSLFQDIPSVIFSVIFVFIWSFIFSWYFSLLFLGLLFFIYFLIKRYYSHSILIIFSTTLISCFFVSYTFNNLPLKDYRPYKEGFNFKEKFNEDFDEIEINESTVFTINDGFADNNVTKAFIDFPSILVSTSYNFEKTNKSSFKEIKKLFHDVKDLEEGVCVMQISSWQHMDSIKSLIGENEIYYYGDNDIGKIIIRSDPGLLLFKDGVLIKKWHSNNVPNIKEVQKLLK